MPPGPAAQPEQAENGKDERDEAVAAAIADHTVASGKLAGSTRLQVPTASTPTSSIEQETMAIRRAVRLPTVRVTVAMM